MSGRIKVLYLAGTDPRDTSYGGAQRTHFIWEGLKKVAEVYTVIPVGRKSLERVDDVDRIRWFCFGHRFTPGWFFNRIWCLVFPRIGLACGVHSLDWAVRQMPVHPDFCVTRYVYMASRFQVWRVAPLVIDVDDLESEVFDTLNQQGQTFAHRLVRKVICAYENRIVGKADHVWVVNPAHLHHVSARTVLPNISAGGKPDFSSVLGDADTLLFVGHGFSSPNYEGLDRFLDRHWAELRRDFPFLKLKIVGRGYPNAFTEKWQQYSGVQLFGFVEDLFALYRDSLCAINPVEIGSGSCIKTIEALSYGRVCVTTVSGARGLPNESGIGVFQFTDTFDLRSILTSIRDPTFRIEAQQQARDYAFRQHSQDVIDEAVKLTMQVMLSKPRTEQENHAGSEKIF